MEVTQPLTVAFYGDGQVSGNCVRILGERRSVTVLGPFGRGEREFALRSGADVVVIATTSFLADVADDIRVALGSGSNVITTAEEAAFPAAVDGAIARELDALARDRNVTVLGAGLNPGFTFDALVLTMTGVCWQVDSIRVERVVDLSHFSAAILRRLGIGFTEEEFDAGARSGTITGHIGFPQSMRVVAGKLGVRLDEIRRQIVPTMAGGPLRAVHLGIETGQSAGFTQRYTGIVHARAWFVAEFTGHISPGAVGLTPRDEIWIDGATPVHMRIDPGLNPQIGSSAIIANSLRRVIAAPPGWLAVGDLPPATAA